MKRKPQPVVRKKRALGLSGDNWKAIALGKSGSLDKVTIERDASRAELAAARDEATKLREERAIQGNRHQMLIDVFPPMQEIGNELGLLVGESIHDKIIPGILKLKAEAASAIDGHDSYIASYALHSKQVLAFLKALPMDQKGVRFLTLGKWDECRKLFEPNI